MTVSLFAVLERSGHPERRRFSLYVLNRSGASVSRAGSLIGFDQPAVITPEVAAYVQAREAQASRKVTRDAYVKTIHRLDHFVKIASPLAWEWRAL